MHASPETATFVGYPGLNDRWSDLSPESIAFGRQLGHRMLAALDSIDRSRLGAAEQVDYDLARRRPSRGSKARSFTASTWRSISWEACSRTSRRSCR